MPKVTFKKSGIEAAWDGSSDSLLEFAESKGLDLDYGCRAGNCTACQQTILEGEVSYPWEPSGVPDEGKELLCCSVPKTDVVVDA